MFFKTRTLQGGLQTPPGAKEFIEIKKGGRGKTQGQVKTLKGGREREGRETKGEGKEKGWEEEGKEKGVGGNREGKEWKGEVEGIRGGEEDEGEGG